MKKLYFTFLTAILSVSVANAQTLTQANHAPTVGDSYATRQCDSTGISAGASGAGALWTFNMAIRTATTNFTGVTVASTGSTSIYPSASVAVKSGANTDKNYYSSTASDLKYWGGVFSVATQPITLYYGVPAIFAKYPMSLATTSNSAVSGSLTTILGGGTFTGNCTVIADGTGTLALPTGTYNSAIRVKTTQTLDFSIPSTAQGSIIETVYDYYSSTQKYPMFTIHSSAFTATVFSLPQSATQTVVTINTGTMSAVQEMNKEVSNLNIFPNPAFNNVNLTYSNDNGENASYEMINAIGQVVKKENLGNEKGKANHSVSLTGIESGIYFVKVAVGNAVSVQKITIR